MSSIAIFTIFGAVALGAIVFLVMRSRDREALDNLAAEPRDRNRYDIAVLTPQRSPSIDQAVRRMTPADNGRRARK